MNYFYFPLPDRDRPFGITGGERKHLVGVSLSLCPVLSPKSFLCNSRHLFDIVIHIVPSGHCFCSRYLALGLQEVSETFLSEYFQRWSPLFMFLIFSHVFFNRFPSCISDSEPPSCWSQERESDTVFLWVVPPYKCIFSIFLLRNGVEFNNPCCFEARLLFWDIFRISDK